MSATGITAIASIGAALIAGITAVIGNIISTRAQQRKNDVEQDRRSSETSHMHDLAIANLQASVNTSMAVMNTKLEQLTSEVREHNNFAKRMPLVEEQIKRIDGDIKDLEKRLEKVEKSKEV